MLPPVIKTIDVPCTPDKAFTIFTSDLGKWWPRDKNSVSAMNGEVAKSVHLDPKMGGTLTEVAPDGTIHNWGSVQEFTPHRRLSLAWHIGRPAEDATSVDVDFAASDTGTTVTLTHKNWEVFGDQAQAMHDGYSNGWVHVVEKCYAQACA